jgi:hypothetical protein
LIKTVFQHGIWLLLLYNILLLIWKSRSCPQYYDSGNPENSVATAFDGITGKRWKVKEKALGELGVVAAHGN